MPQRVSLSSSSDCVLVLATGAPSGGDDDDDDDEEGVGRGHSAYLNLRSDASVSGETPFGLASPNRSERRMSCRARNSESQPGTAREREWATHRLVTRVELVIVLREGSLGVSLQSSLELEERAPLTR